MFTNSVYKHLVKLPRLVNKQFANRCLQTMFTNTFSHVYKQHLCLKTVYKQELSLQTGSHTCHVSKQTAYKQVFTNSAYKHVLECAMLVNKEFTNRCLQTVFTNGAVFTLKCLQTCLQTGANLIN